MPTIEERERPTDSFIGPLESTEVFVCECCDEETQNAHGDNKIEVNNGDVICRGCFIEHYYSCESCGEMDRIDESYRAPNEELYCDSCMSDSFSHCDDCNEPLWNEDSFHSERDDYYRCETCHSEVGDDSENFLEESPKNISVRHDKSEMFNFLDVKRLVGIEAECVFGDCDTDEDGSPMALTKIPNGWNETYDGSIEGNGRELIASPSNGNILWSRVKLLERWAIDNDVYVNRSCGMHIHFDATDTTWQDLRAIALVTLKIEQHLFDMLPPSRQNSRWCKRISMNAYSLMNCSSSEEFTELWYDESGISRDKYNDSRYHGLNLHARYYLGTIEFRYHSGTLNADKIINWIKICNSIVSTGIKLSRDKNWFKGIDFYNDTSKVELVEGGYRRDQKLSSLSEILKHMVDMDISTVKYMLERMKKFNPSAKEERINTIDSYLLNL